MIDQTNRQDDTLAHDLLVGGRAIGRHIGQGPRFVYHHQKALGLRRIDGTLVGSKQHLRKVLSAGD